MINGKVFCAVVMTRKVLSSHSYSLSIQTTVSQKNYQTNKGYSKKFAQRYIFHSVAKDPDPNKGVKMQRKFLFLGFYNHLPYT